MKDQLFAASDLRTKWRLLCALAQSPETERLFAAPADRARLNGIIDEVCAAIRRGELKESGEEEK